MRPCAMMILMVLVAEGAAGQMGPSERTASFDPICEEPSAPLLILGTYHFANPGLDARRFVADDVLAPHRQDEIEAVAEALAAFRPTKVAVEAPFGSDDWPRLYRRWVERADTLRRNEIAQLGFRIAARMGHDHIWPVDYSMWMNGWRPDEIAFEGRPAHWQEILDPPAPAPKAPVASDASASTSGAADSGELSDDERRLRETTIGQYLAMLNSEESIAEHHAPYLRMLRPPNSQGIYSNTDAVTNWYARNLRIFTNLVRITDPRSDRILLIMGTGHVKILRELARDATYFCVVDPLEYLSEEPA